MKHGQWSPSQDFPMRLSCLQPSRVKRGIVAEVIVMMEVMVALISDLDGQETTHKRQLFLQFKSVSKKYPSKEAAAASEANMVMSENVISSSIGNYESKEVIVSLIQRDINFFPPPVPSHDGLLERSSFLLERLNGIAHHAKAELVKFLRDWTLTRHRQTTQGKLQQINFTATRCRHDEKQPIRAQRNLIPALKR
ncbi:uncharacterized protein NECHADRAFT_88325 [Fusarium vanettenii 77-13-4]|uniref:Uncharacterized protein n=1 Tax=Fusarium vanettenii (strain ATCC MYA-4622 / CBS 123669 / FGSC 9596 / NRRL 45880 / 77-13-4) TaxID=660122 RepID=C7ZDL5_FUSV7|nr:uncharacterized protein NECHADRAFT_88325 [Fusarium vanettenii 77-13-4]EEU37963.1 predicted protein [Fusarium vanettenii 77-13-4]